MFQKLCITLISLGLRAGFDYTYRDLALYGSISSYIDHEWRTNAKTGLNWKF